MSDMLQLVARELDLPQIYTETTDFAQILVYLRIAIHYRTGSGATARTKRLSERVNRFV